MTLVFTLLVFFQLKHFLADYPLQNKYMLGKFLPGWEFFKPLLTHAAVHGVLTAVIVYLFTDHLWLALGLGSFDLTAHFLMDRIKAGPKYLGRYKPLAPSEFRKAWPRQRQENTYFWWSLGLDQMVHHLTHYVIIYIVAWYLL